MSAEENEDATCYQYAGSVSNPFQALITGQFETINSVMCEPPIGIDGWGPAH